MSDAPERIWAQDAEPSECDYTGGGWWDDECGHTQYQHMVEYVRADTLTALQAENERLREALEQINSNCTAMMVPSSVIEAIIITALSQTGETTDAEVHSSD